MATTMTDVQLDAIHEEASKRVRVSCTDYHQHSALSDCLDGDQKDILICQLVETLRFERQMVREVAKKIGSGVRG